MYHQTLEGDAGPATTELVSQVPSAWALINACGEATNVNSWCAKEEDEGTNG